MPRDILNLNPALRRVFANEERVSGEGVADSCDDNFLSSNELVGEKAIFSVFFICFKFISERNRVPVILPHHTYFCLIDDFMSFIGKSVIAG